MYLPFTIVEWNWGITVEVHRLKWISRVSADWRWRDQVWKGFCC